MSNIEYNGYHNYETWAVSRHIDNDQYLQDEIQKMVNLARTQYELAETIKEFVGENMIKENDKHIANLFVNDIINAALSEVNWQELAEKYTEEFVEEEVQS